MKGAGVQTPGKQRTVLPRWNRPSGTKGVWCQAFLCVSKPYSELHLCAIWLLKPSSSQTFRIPRKTQYLGIVSTVEMSANTAVTSRSLHLELKSFVMVPPPPVQTYFHGFPAWILCQSAHSFWNLSPAGYLHAFVPVALVPGTSPSWFTFTSPPWLAGSTPAWSLASASPPLGSQSTLCDPILAP